MLAVIEVHPVVISYIDNCLIAASRTSSVSCHQYGELRPTNGWDRFWSLEHTCKFQRVSRLGRVTAWHSSSGHQPNFVVLSRGRHLYSAGWTSCWALAHILVFIIQFQLILISVSVHGYITVPFRVLISVWS